MVPVHLLLIFIVLMLMTYLALSHQGLSVFGFVQGGYRPFRQYDRDKRISSYMELGDVVKSTLERSGDDVAFHMLTDRSVSDAFIFIVRHLGYTVDDLDSIITKHNPYIMSMKNRFNRIRPYQLHPEIDKLPSVTSHTPAYPAGHAYQAYLLAHTLSSSHPELHDALFKCAHRCDDVRVKAGLHYKSDGEFSRQLLHGILK